MDDAIQDRILKEGGGAEGRLLARTAAQTGIVAPEELLPSVPPAATEALQLWPSGDANGSTVIPGAAVENLILPFATCTGEEHWQWILAGLLEARDGAQAADPPPSADFRPGEPSLAGPSTELAGRQQVTPPEDETVADAPAHRPLEAHAFDLSYGVAPVGPSLALQNSDLFGAAQPAPSIAVGDVVLGDLPDGGLALDLFGQGAIGFPAGDPAPTHAQPDDPTTGDKAAEPQLRPGYVGLIGNDFDISVSTSAAVAAADAKGELLVQGDGDDRVVLTGDWLQLAAPEGGALLFRSADGAVTLEIRDAAVEYQVYV